MGAIELHRLHSVSFGEGLIVRKPFTSVRRLTGHRRAGAECRSALPDHPDFQC